MFRAWSVMDFTFNAKMERMPQDKIKQLQLKRLKQTVNLVYEKVPLYRRKLKKLKS